MAYTHHINQPERLNIMSSAIIQYAEAKTMMLTERGENPASIPLMVKGSIENVQRMFRHAEHLDAAVLDEMEWELEQHRKKYPAAKRVLSVKEESWLGAADARLSKKQGYTSTDTATSIHRLLDAGAVEVGYRSSCGVTDPTIFAHREFIKALKRLKINVTEKPVHHDNSYATISGGFWRSIVYTVIIA